MQRAFAAALLFGLVAVGCDKNKSVSTLDPDIARFIAAKRIQAQQTPAAQSNGLPNTYWQVFDAAEENRFERTTNLFATLQLQAGRYSTPSAAPGPLGQVWHGVLQTVGLRPSYSPSLNTEAWAPVHEVLGIIEIYHDWDHKWMRRFGRDIIDSIPSNSIYFGGTDGGRFIVTALSESHATGTPFYTLTQNALADGSYLPYLEFMYGSRIRIPSPQDSQQAFQDYLQDAQRRKETDKLKPGKTVQVVSGRVQVSGEVAVMQVNALIAYNIFTNNPDREFFIEESFSLDWMYPYLSPHGLILKLNREPLAELSDEIVKRDHEYWARYTKELIGDWLTPETSIETVCAFSKKVYLSKDLSGFTGDTDYARNEAAQKSFARLRGKIAGVYGWRAAHAKPGTSKALMNREADFAFKQALALGPILSETVAPFVNVLAEQGRVKDVEHLAKTLSAFVPEDQFSKQLIEYVPTLQSYLSTNQPSAK